MSTSISNTTAKLNATVRPKTLKQCRMRGYMYQKRRLNPMCHLRFASAREWKNTMSVGLTHNCIILP